ncbi:MAG: peptide-methionine (S)-S-oxide reductase MsrA [Nitrospirae bacterium]|nr:MAG: peptide-methionine (S)-S-oxide reductase MsrA [Nitrospirota bacterium]
MKIQSLLGLLIFTVLLAAVPVMADNATKQTGDRLLEKATFAGGCFWCMEEAFEGVEGVVSVTSGYTGGRKANPDYEEVSAGGTGHAESVEILYDPTRVTYAKLLEIFWRNIDPTTPDRQFCDGGNQYRSAIFYQDETQKRLAEESKQAVERTKPFKGPIVTQIVPASAFYVAEDYHQDFYKKNPIRYKFYKYNCGRAQRLAELWEKKN